MAAHALKKALCMHSLLLRLDSTSCNSAYCYEGFKTFIPEGAALDVFVHLVLDSCRKSCHSSGTGTFRHGLPTFLLS